MLYKNHLIISSAAALPIMSATNTLTIPNLIALGLGALLPDIDEPHSFIGRRTRGISDLIHLIFKHRGLTHSIFFVAVIGAITIPLGSNWNFGIAAAYLTLGCFLHILEDSFSKSGVKWLLPVSEASFQNKLYYTTGSLVEYGIGLLGLLIIYYQITTLDYRLSYSHFLGQLNLTEFFLMLKDKVGDFVMK